MKKPILWWEMDYTFDNLVTLNATLEISLLSFLAIGWRNSFICTLQKLEVWMPLFTLIVMTLLQFWSPYFVMPPQNCREIKGMVLEMFDLNFVKKMIYLAWEKKCPFFEEGGFCSCSQVLLCQFYWQVCFQNYLPLFLREAICLNVRQTWMVE